MGMVNVVSKRLCAQEGCSKLSSLGMRQHKNVGVLQSTRQVRDGLRPHKKVFQ